MLALIERMPVYAKAIYAGISAALLTLATILVGDMTLGELTQAQWLMVVIAFLGVGGGTAAIPNAKTPQQKETEILAAEARAVASLGNKNEVLMDAGVYDAEDLPDDTEELNDDLLEDDVDATPAGEGYEPKHAL
jgi:predicted regulator of Ras-like GTPase activity (Roadblock/LC7/MglB family)